DAEVDAADSYALIKLAANAYPSDIPTRFDGLRERFHDESNRLRVGHVPERHGDAWLRGIALLVWGDLLADDNYRDPRVEALFGRT
ncbi:MAG: hypothetical protein Q8K63_00320, partial [Acidimicrobiales bacterium]|nr:hypothetical protein [Acidimicrobiales bacterium]